jgi:hypothetical protein
MADELAQPQSFQERMKERIRESIGELLTDEELKQMIDRTMEEIFFTSRVVDDGRWHKRTVPPLLHEIVEGLVKPRVTACVEEYVKEHAEEIARLTHAALTENLGETIVRGFARAFSSPLMNMTFEMQEAVKRLAEAGS